MSRKWKLLIVVVKRLLLLGENIMEIENEHWRLTYAKQKFLHIPKMNIYIELPSVHCYIVVILFLQIIAFDELKTDYKNPIDQCNTLNPVSVATIPDTSSLPLWLHADMLCWKMFYLL